MSSTRQIAYFNPDVTGVPVSVQVADVASIDKADIPAFNNAAAEYHLVISFIESRKPAIRLRYTGLVRRNNEWNKFMSEFGDPIVGS
jgi:hypothetical protein